MTWRQGLCFGAFLMVAVVVCVAASDTHLTNSFIVEVQDGDSPHSLAKRHNLDYLGQVRIIDQEMVSIPNCINVTIGSSHLLYSRIYIRARIGDPYASIY